VLPSVSLRSGLQSIVGAVKHVGKELGRLVTHVLPDSSAIAGSARTRAPAGTAKTRVAARGAPGARYDRRWLWAAWAVPLVVALLMVLSRVQHGRAVQAEYQQLLDSIEQTKLSAELSPTASEQRANIASTLTLIEKALAIKPQEQGLVTEREAMQSWLDRVNRVSRLFYFSLLQELPSGAGNVSSPQRVIATGNDVFVLDAGTQRVYQYLLNEAGDGLQTLTDDPVLLRAGDQYEGAVVGPLLDMAWVEAGGFRGTSGLFIVDQQAQAFVYDALMGMAHLPNLTTALWQSPRAVSGYVGRLYLLDTQAKDLYRHVLTNTGYEGEPSTYFLSAPQADLGTAVDLAIDGNVYILHSDGQISKYQEGVPVPFSQEGIDEPMRSPTSICSTGFMDEEGYVFVADSGNQRIVQFSKTGGFVRQLRASDPVYMDNLKSVFVDATTNRIFLLNRNMLYLAYLPE